MKCRRKFHQLIINIVNQSIKRVLLFKREITIHESMWRYQSYSQQTVNQ